MRQEKRGEGIRHKKERPNHQKAPKYNVFLSIIRIRKAHEWLGRLLVMAPKSSRSRRPGFTEREYYHIKQYCCQTMPF
jgi:hypothetical protein